MWGAIATALAPTVGGILGNMLSSGDRNGAVDATGRAMQELIAVGMPPDTAKRVIMEKFQSAGMLDPEMEKAINLNISKVAGIQEDPALKERQMSALNLIAQRASGGLNAEDRAKFNELRNQQAKEQEAKQQQIIQQYQMRGMGGAGAELAAALAESQSGANQASDQGDRLAAASSNTAREAALQVLQGGGTIRQQDFDVNKTRATAEDEMNRFNVANQIAQQTRNVGTRNQAQERNLNNQQQIMNANIGMENNERQRMNTAAGEDWDRKLKRATGMTSAAKENADALNRRATQTRGMWSDIGSGLGGGIGKYLTQQGNNNAPVTTQTSFDSELDFNNISPRAKKFARSDYDPSQA